jgi:S-adenosylmethionine hydrolase
LGNTIRGEVVEISSRGDLVTDIAVDSLADVPSDDSVTVSVGPHETVGIFDVDHDQPESTMIAVRGASGFLEIGIVGTNMSEMLGIRVGEPVHVNW